MERRPMTIQEAALNLQGAANPASQVTPVEHMLNLQKKQQQIANEQQLRVQQARQNLSDIQSKEAPKDYTAVAALADLFRPQGAQGPSMTQLYQGFRPRDTRLQEQQMAQRELLAAQGAYDKTQLGILQNQLAQAQGQEKFDMQQALLDKRLQGQRDLAEFTADQNIRLAEAKQGMKGAGIGALTKGQEAADKEFGKDYQKWVAGGFSNVQGNLEKLQNSLTRINQDDEVGNTMLTETLRANNPFGNYREGLAVEQDIGNVVFQSLKEILGGQFTEKEGQKLVQQTYDPRLPDTENAKKVQAAMDKLSTMAEAKQGAVDYFAKNGTLKGYMGSSAGTMEQFQKELKDRYIGGQENKKMSAEEELRKELGL